MPRLSSDTRRSLRRLAAHGNDWAASMLDLYDGPKVSPEVFAARMAALDDATDTIRADAPHFWRVSGPLPLRDRGSGRRVDVPPGTTLRYEHRGTGYSDHDYRGCRQSVSHRFRVLDGPDAGREVEYTEAWEGKADDCSDLRCIDPFPPTGLRPIRPA